MPKHYRSLSTATITVSGTTADLHVVSELLLSLTPEQREKLHMKFSLDAVEVDPASGWPIAWTDKYEQKAEAAE